jgi:hypothetical protein
MKKILFTLALLISLSSFGQQFNDWKYYEDDSYYYLSNSNGIEVKNCESVPKLIVLIQKDDNGTMQLSLNGEIYPNYNGDEIKLNLTLRGEDGKFYSGYGEEVKAQEFDTYFNGVGWLYLKYGKYSPLDVITALFYNPGVKDFYEQVYIQTILNGESKVIRFSLKGYRDAFNLFDAKFEENRNPFEN